MDANKSYRNNLIERLDSFLKDIKKEGEDCRVLSKDVEEREDYYMGGEYVAQNLSVKFQNLFSEELKK